MLSLQNIHLYFGDLHLLDDINFTISNNEKIALIGKNGAGKTTLFKIITSELSPDQGQVQMPGDYRIAYLSQHLDFDNSKTIEESCREVFSEYFSTKARIAELNQELAAGDESKLSKILEELDLLELKLSSWADNNPLSEISRILKGLGFREEQFSQVVSNLSGGWQMRVQIARLLLQSPDLLLLDEPDNHLDIEALIWFEKYIKAYPGSVLLISHDVEFMSNTAQRIFELANRSLSDYKMGYRRYLEEKAVRLEKEAQAFANQQKLIKDKERTINRFMAKATKTKMAQSMKKQLDKIERIELESQDITSINIQFPQTKASGKEVIKINKLSKSFGDNHVINNLDMLVERGQKIAFIGQNGQGKSTLIKMIAGTLKPDSGSIEQGYNLELSYFAQNQSERFDNKLNVLETLEMEADPQFHASARKILGAFAFSGEDVYKKVSVLSGGEKARLALACLVSRKSNLLLLDEPTNHLDIHSKSLLKDAIKNYPGTLIIVSHDREILRGIIDISYEFRDGLIHQHLGDLDYVLSKRAAEDMREFELKTGDKNVKNAEQTKKQNLDYNQLKQINRNISRVEKKIEQTEKDLALIQEKLIDLEFYKSEEGQKAIKNLQRLEESLEELNVEWDEWVSKLDI